MFAAMRGVGAKRARRGRNLKCLAYAKANNSLYCAMIPAMVLAEVQQKTHATAGAETTLRDWVRALEATASIAADPRRLLAGIIEEQAQASHRAPALLSAGERLSYGALTERAHAFARWALELGLAKGDVVGLMMPNRPEYLAVWLGLTSVGAVVALINTQLHGRVLAHSVDVAKPKHVIVTAELLQPLEAAVAQSATKPKIWAHGPGAGAAFDRVDRAIERHSGGPLRAAERRAVTIHDPALLIYTSGTTGLPKAAYVSHRRLLQWSLWFAGLIDTTPADRMYDCLPLYHSVGGVVATGALLVRGGSVLIRDKFSARHFWDDVVDGGCTLFQYIGELPRYLLNAPDNPRWRAHRLRLCCGNGLGADVWEQFQRRFAIPRILEFYAATEGNFSLYNVEGKVGAVGRVPSFLAHRFPLALVKYDPATGAPARDRHGFCIRCTTDEIGEAIGRIRTDASLPGGDFEGYTDAKESRRKVLRNVFARGDAWYRTGDLMRRDAGGFFYFVDRAGDTFRWKGENVATAEVAAAITAFAAVKEATVYGVRVPGTDGAAGMAALVVEGELDLPRFRRHLAQTLPPYARPLFLRVTERIDATATFKHRKNVLKREGYDPAASRDAIYVDHPTKKAYVRLDGALYSRILAGKLRF
jgi:fatty-acyl-CoA synthase